MKSGWTRAPLKNACSDFKAAIVDGPFGSNLKREHFITEGVPVLKIQNIKEFHINDKKIDHVSPEKAQELSRHAFCSGDIIMTKLGDPLGVSAIVKNVDKGIIVADLVRIRADKINTEFLCYQLNSPLVREALNSQQKGATRPRVKISMVRDLLINIPSIEEQRRIVSVLDKAFAAIATATANAEKNLANARALFESYLQSVFDGNPDKVTTYDFGDESLIKIIDGDRGRNYPKKSDFSDQGHCLFLNTKNVRTDGFNFDTTMFVSKDTDESLRKGKLTRGDVIMTTRGTIGNIGVYDEGVQFEHVRINSGMLIFRPNNQKISSRYLFEILRSGIFKKQMAENVSGAAQPQLPIKTLVKFKIPVPKELSDQSVVVEQLAEMESSTNKLEQLYLQKIASLSELKQSLLQKAFAGEPT